MTTLAAALLTAGFVLSVFGTSGFALVWTTAPDRADLIHARRLATAGRWATAAGLALLWSSPASVGGITGLCVTLAVLAAAATLLTKAPLRHFEIA